MNADVLKSLGYLKKSLGMSNRAIANAIKRDPNDDVSDKLQGLIDELMDTIDSEVAKAKSVVNVPSVGVQFSVPPASPIAPMVQMVAQNDALDNSTGIDFLVP
jgi:hypothetical protein